MALFDPITLRGVTLPNRIVKSAMGEGCADAEGRPTPTFIRMYSRWAKGGAGLAITGMVHVRQGYSYTRELGLYSDALIAPLRELTDASHRNGGRIFAQLCHASPQIPRAKARLLGAVAPSSGFVLTNGLYQRAIDSHELASLTHEFGQAARRAREAGFDGVQLHAAHGYMLSRTISPKLNRRRDRWGGSFERRLTFLREVYHQVRRAVGDDYPVTIKLNAHDAMRGGLDLDSSISIGARLESWGIDAIEVSAGHGEVGMGIYPNRGDMPVELSTEFMRREVPLIRPLVPLLVPLIRLLGRSVRLTREAYFFELARRFADALSVPIICVGGIRSRSAAEQILATSRVAMVSLARPLLRQPGLPRAWEQGGSDRAQCVSCNKCFIQLGLDQPLRCWEKITPP